MGVGPWRALRYRALMDATGRVYVVGAYIPRGGTRMAYALGRVLHERFDKEVIVVRVGDETPAHGIFDYPHQFDLIDLASMEAHITERDLLIANPSFSDHLFGPRLPGTKLMYVQDFKTFAVIDGFFNHYVCCSRCIAHFLKLVYDMEVPVIPLCYHAEDVPEPVPWDERVADEIVVVGKHYAAELFAIVEREMKARGVTHRLRLVTDGIPHRELLAEMARHRYFMAITPAEGFGLTPLEAMACGCAVMGFHGCGGLEYMRSGENCDVAPYPDVAGMVDHAAALLADDGRARKLAEQSLVDAPTYEYTEFERSWVSYLRDEVGR